MPPRVGAVHSPGQPRVWRDRPADDFLAAVRPACWVRRFTPRSASDKAASAGKSISYRDYFFPGTLVLILLFTAIFATISIIEDRREGFLQSVLVAPIPRWSMVPAKCSAAR